MLVSRVVTASLGNALLYFLVIDETEWKGIRALRYANVVQTSIWGIVSVDLSMFRSLIKT